jgi:hypothetical protein
MDEGLAGLAAGYGFTEPSVGLGRAVKGEEVATGFEVAVPLATAAVADGQGGALGGADDPAAAADLQGLGGGSAQDRGSRVAAVRSRAANPRSPPGCRGPGGPQGPYGWGGG